LLTEQQVVVAVAVEGWVEVDEVDALVGQVLAHHFQVIAIVEGVVGHAGDCTRSVFVTFIFRSLLVIFWHSHMFFARR
jgi:hypothetical protein